MLFGLIEERLFAKDRLSMQGLEEKINNIELLVQRLYDNSKFSDKQPGAKEYKHKIIYEVFVGGKPTGVTGSRDYCENLIVSVAPRVTYNLPTKVPYKEGMYPNDIEAGVTQKQNF